MAGLKKAPKMTDADELYLRKFLQYRKEKDIAQIKDTIVGQRSPNESEGSQDEGGPSEDYEVQINTRLFLERNRHISPEKASYRAADGSKVSLTNQIFGEKHYFKQQEDTTEDRDMHDYV